MHVLAIEKIILFTSEFSFDILLKQMWDIREIFINAWKLTTCLVTSRGEWWLFDKEDHYFSYQAILGMILNLKKDAKVHSDYYHKNYKSHQNNNQINSNCLVIFLKSCFRLLS